VNGNPLDEAKGTSTEPSSRLFHNNHDGTFSDVTHEAALEFTGWGRGLCVGDYDNDGFDDLLVTYYGKNRLYHEEGNGSFKESCSLRRSCWRWQGVGNGLRLCRPRPRWKARSFGSELCPVRYQDRTRARPGGEMRVERQPGYVRTAWPRVLAEYPLSQSRWGKVRGRHFGPGSSGAVDRIEIRWPNSNSESFPGGSADRFVALIEGRSGTRHGS
jgi:hypothetical protein